MFSEDVVLGGLKAGPSWFVSDHTQCRLIDSPSVERDYEHCIAHVPNRHVPGINFTCSVALSGPLWHSEFTRE